MLLYCCVSMKIIILFLVIYSTCGFNFSPKPNLIFREPDLKTYKPKVRSSYFGFTINLRKSSVIIGAPRAQSTLESQKKINETGAIYKCSLNGTCAPYVFDSEGNVNAEFNASTYDTQQKDNQWLGASMDGGTKDTDKLIVCAPRLMPISSDLPLMHGICYETPDTLSDHPQNVKKIAPLRLRANSKKAAGKYLLRYHALGEQGISVHMTDDNEEILIGAPGIFMGKGSVLQCGLKNDNCAIPDHDYQQYNTYFGYAVSSGNFKTDLPNKTFYVATAPRSNVNSGEAYIFDIIRANSKNYMTKKYYAFIGTQLGEYYGYAVLTEDLNGDGLKDIVITAPLHSSEDNYEQGAVYVYINKGKFAFELQKMFISPVKGIGRFGSTITKLGDINLDGYNDIAIGAPLAEANGVVFIFLGCAQGLRDEPSQKLAALPALTSWGPHMFGHGLSKGSDIDNNGYNDFAIGAPNAETVYIYRAYPIVKIFATMNFLSRQIKPDQNKFQMSICYMMSTKSTKIKNSDISIRINVDPLVQRVSFQETGSGVMVLNVTAILENQCQQLDASVRFSAATVFRPIDLEMKYELINGVPYSEEFCDKCSAMDPADSKVQKESLVFTTGCIDICITDLKITSSGLSPTYTLGSSRTISVTYEVSNSGEFAYQPQINITSSNKMAFAKIPSSCNQQGHILLCDLNRRHLMAAGDSNNITIVYEVSQIEGTSMTLTATVFSTGKEKNPDNNIVEDLIGLVEFTDIEAIGMPNTSVIRLEDELNTAEIMYNYEVKSNGPSLIQELEIILEIPIAYTFLESNVTIPIIDSNNITVQGFYGDRVLSAELSENRNLLSRNQTEINNIRGQPSTSKESQSFETHFDNESSTIQPTKYSPQNHSKDFMGTLPINRTIVFSCIDPETTICVTAVLKVLYFEPEIPVTIDLKYHVDLTEVNELLIKPWEFFVISTKFDIIKVGDPNGKSINITRKLEYNIISKDQSLAYKVPIWVILVAVLIGLIVLGATTYGLHKVGFFRRKIKEGMAKLIQDENENTSEAND